MADHRLPRIPRGGMTARELAEKTGYTVRTAMKWTAEPRELYLERAAQRRRRIRELRAQGLSMRAIAEIEQVSVGTVHYALHHEDD